MWFGRYGKSVITPEKPVNSVKLGIPFSWVFIELQFVKEEFENYEIFLDIYLARFLWNGNSCLDSLVYGDWDETVSNAYHH